MNLYLKKIEKTLGSAKFAVGIILVFAVALIYGTFMESYHGTEFAGRHVYKSPFFFFLQFLMFLSIATATIQRFPYRPQLAGFYVLHLGLLILFAGSFITFYSGVDGSMTLPPNIPNRNITLPDDEFEVRFLDKGVKLVTPMPYRAFETTLNQVVQSESVKDIPKIEITRFLPFVKEKTTWTKNPDRFRNRGSAQYQLFNDRFSEKLTLSLSPLSSFESSTVLGLLNVHYLPEQLWPCFKANHKSRIIFWDSLKSICFTPEMKKMKKRMAPKGQIHYMINEMGNEYHFFPAISPLAMNKDLKPIESSPYRIFDLSLFQKKPHLFTFGETIAYYDKDEEAWFGESFEKNPLIDLPWMGFQLRLLQYQKDMYPEKIPHPTRPVQDNGKLIVGEDKAVEIKVANKNYWIRQSDGPMQMVIEGQKVVFELKKKQLTLGYQLNLDRFEMKTDPGTNNPASYESFVSLFDGTNTSKFHIFMNNPLKYQDFTFYQASYFEAQGGGYGSVLSVNFDPGRPWKYFGSLLLVLGSMWHFGVRFRKRKKYVESTIRATA